MNEPSPLRQIVERALRLLDSRLGRRALLGLTVFVLLVFAAASIRPNIQGTSEARAETEDVSQTITTETQQIKILQDRLQANEGTDLAKVLQTALPDAVHNDHQLEVLSRLAEKTGTEIQTFEPGPIDAAGGYSLMSVSLAVKGTLENGLRFVSGLQGLARGDQERLQADGPIWSVEQISLAPTGENDLSMQLTAKLYLSASAQPADPSTSGATP